MLTGRYEHNNRVSSLAGGGCMHMNSSRVDNPDFWTTSHVVRLHKLGYTTGGYTTPPPLVPTWGFAAGHRQRPLCA